MDLDIEKLDYGYDKDKPTRQHIDLAFYKGKSWRRFRISVMSKPENVFCRAYMMVNRLEYAVDLDHIIRMQEGGASLDRRNVQPLSRKAHSIKSALEGAGRFDNLVEGRDYINTRQGKIPTQHYIDYVLEAISEKLWRVNRQDGK